MLPVSAACGRSAATNYEGRKRALRTRSSTATAKASSSCLLWLKLAVVGGTTLLLPFGKNLGRCMELAIGLTASQGVEQLLQALSVALQRENARAVLRRLPPADDVSCFAAP